MTSRAPLGLFGNPDATDPLRLKVQALGSVVLQVVLLTAFASALDNDNANSTCTGSTPGCWPGSLAGPAPCICDASCCDSSEDCDEFCGCGGGRCPPPPQRLPKPQLPSPRATDFCLQQRVAAASRFGARRACVCGGGVWTDDGPLTGVRIDS